MLNCTFNNIILVIKQPIENKLPKECVIPLAEEKYLYLSAKGE